VIEPEARRVRAAVANCTSSARTRPSGSTSAGQGARNRDQAAEYACRSCEKTGADTVAGVIQAPAPARLIEGGLPTEAMVADVVVSKHADHLPLYRQSQIPCPLWREDRALDLAQWSGRGCRAAASARSSDQSAQGVTAAVLRQTRCPVLDPGAGKTKTGYMWAIARDDRPWGGGVDATGHPEHRGSGPPAVATPMHRVAAANTPPSCSNGFNGILQVDGYAAYKKLAAPTRLAGR